MDNDKLPTIEELNSDNLELAYKRESLNFLLNQPPPAKFIKQHPFIKKEIFDSQGQKIKVPYEYLPIDKVEYLLRRIFKHVSIEVLDVKVLFNAVSCTVRIHYFDPVTKTMCFHDGVGAKELQTKKDSSPADLANINNGAVAMALPIAKTEAVKDGSHHFGKLFGADLNRNDTMAFEFDKKLDKESQLIELMELFELKKDYMNPEDVQAIDRIIATKEKRSYTKTIKKLAEL